MEPRFPPEPSEPERRLWASILRPMAAELSEEAASLSTEIVDSIRDQFPELFTVEGGFEENRAATEANLVLIAGIIEQGQDPGAFDLPEPAAAYTYDAVHRGVPLAALHRSIRLGHASLWGWLEAQLDLRVSDQPDRYAASRLVSSWLFAIVDALSNAVEIAYTDERERWLRTAAAIRTDTIAAILAGEDIDVHTASRRLGYELDRHHVAVIAWVDTAEEGRDTLSALDHAIEALSSATGAGAMLARPSGIRAIQAWLSFAAGPDAAAFDAARIDPGNAPGVRVAVGEACPGLGGFRTTHEQAVLARRVATLSGWGPGAVTRYGRVALQAIASTDLKQAHAFARRELGQLAADDDTSARLAATLQVYLDEHGSRSRTAKRLGVHENTISYRMRQVEDLLGRSLEGDTLNLRAALAIAPIVRGAGMNLD